MGYVEALSGLQPLEPHICVWLLQAKNFFRVAAELLHCLQCRVMLLTAQAKLLVMIDAAEAPQHM